MLRLRQVVAVLQQQAALLSPSLPDGLWQAPSSLQQLRGAKKVAAEERSVHIVLLQDVYGFGRKGEVKVANPGWVRHKLFPRGAALYATPDNVTKYARSQDDEGVQDKELLVEKEVLRLMRILSHRQVDISRKAMDDMSEATAAAAADGKPAAAPAAPDAGLATAGAAGGAAAADGDAGGAGVVPVMKGSVTPYDIRQAVLKQTGVQLHESHLLLDKPITTFGTFKVPLNLRMLDDHQVELQVTVHKVKTLKHGKASV